MSEEERKKAPKVELCTLFVPKKEILTTLPKQTTSVALSLTQISSEEGRETVRPETGGKRSIV